MLVGTLDAFCQYFSTLCCQGAGAIRHFAFTDCEECEKLEYYESYLIHVWVSNYQVHVAAIAIPPVDYMAIVAAMAIVQY